MITHDARQQVFHLELDGNRAVVEYHLSGNVMTITHTRVPDAIAGRGLAADLNQAALEHARQSGWVVVPGCSYTEAYIRRHPRYQDLVME